MANKKITEFSTATSAANTDAFLIETAEGTKNITFDKLCSSIKESGITDLNKKNVLGFVANDSSKNDLEIVLNDDIDNYSQIYVCGTYYSNGLASYGGVIFPKEILKMYSASGNMITLNLSSPGLNASRAAVWIYFAGQRSIKITSNKGNTINPYFTVIGIK